MAQIANFEDGARKALEDILAKSSSPVLVSVYGPIDAGKSFLISYLARELRQQEKTVFDYGSAPDSSTFVRIRDDPSSFKADFYLFHCAWFKLPKAFFEAVSGHEDPGVLAKKILDRDVDYEIFIYNPDNFADRMGNSRIIRPGLYDLVIANANSSEKQNFANT